MIFSWRICFLHLNLIKLMVLRCVIPFPSIILPGNVTFKQKNVLATKVMLSNYSLCWETTEDPLVLLSGFQQAIYCYNTQHLFIIFDSQWGVTTIFEMLTKLLKWSFILEIESLRILQLKSLRHFYRTVNSSYASDWLDSACGCDFTKSV